MSKKNTLLISFILLICIIIFTGNLFINRLNESFKSVKTEREFEELESGEPVAVETDNSWESPQKNLEVWNSVNQMPGDPDAVNTWYTIGPIGFNSGSGVTHTGRVYDIKPYSGFVRAGTVGGLFQSAGGLFWVAKSDKEVQSMYVTTFDSKPGDDNYIIIGSGDRTPNSVGPGNAAGIWITSNAGTNWTRVEPSINFGVCRIIRFAGATRVYAGTTTGFFVSTNSGLNWTNYYPGADVMNFCFRSDNPNVILIGVRNSGVFRSISAVPAFSMVTNGLPASNYGSIGLCASQSTPGAMYVSVCDQNQLVMVKKSTDGGATWNIDISPPLSMRNNFANFGTNVLKVSPFNNNVILLGAIPLFRTSNEGVSWTELNDANLHVDYHCIEFYNVNTVYTGNHGGMQVSLDAGLTWSSASNYLPTAMFFHFDVGIFSGTHKYILGGLFDNGIVRTTDRGVTWSRLTGRDGISAGLYQDLSGNSFVITTAISGGAYLHIDRTTNGGGVFQTAYTGLDTPYYSENFKETIKFSVLQSRFYTFNSGTSSGLGKIFYSTNIGQSWNQLGPTLNKNIFAYDVGDDGLLYAALNDNGSERLKYFNNSGTVTERSLGLPAGRFVYGVNVKRTQGSVVCVSLRPGAGDELFRSTDYGVTWASIQGNLPQDLPIGDILVHPTDNNIIYAATGGSLYFSYNGFGVFRTTNGGVNWARWNNGMPNACFVTDLKGIDSTSINGKFYVAAATLGRGIWVRESSGDDPTGISNNEIPRIFELSQNYPNPFNPVTTINYRIAKSGTVRLTVFDVNGKQVSLLISRFHKPGKYSIEFDGSSFASGVYFYRLETVEYADVKKMILIK